jgi:hypothetical protein
LYKTALDSVVICQIFAGGGNLDEGELIEVVEMGIEDTKSYIQSEDVLSPGAFLFALTWYLRTKETK